jgi:hypothetical protein
MRDSRAVPGGSKPLVPRVRQMNVQLHHKSHKSMRASGVRRRVDRAAIGSALLRGKMRMRAREIIPVEDQARDMTGPRRDPPSARTRS